MIISIHKKYIANHGEKNSPNLKIRVEIYKKKIIWLIIN